jgi:hypothetical protein
MKSGERVFPSSFSESTPDGSQHGFLGAFLIWVAFDSNTISVFVLNDVLVPDFALSFEDGIGGMLALSFFLSFFFLDSFAGPFWSLRTMIAPGVREHISSLTRSLYWMQWILVLGKMKCCKTAIEFWGWGRTFLFTRPLFGKYIEIFYRNIFLANYKLTNFLAFCKVLCIIDIITKN